MTRIIATLAFTDGTQRDVHEDDEGRQFVVNEEGQAVYGIWILAEKPAVHQDCFAVRGSGVASTDLHSPPGDL
jgi:hypothetical protein